MCAPLRAPRIGPASGLFLSTLAITITNNLLKWINCVYPGGGTPPHLVVTGPLDQGGVVCWAGWAAWRAAASLVAFAVFVLVGMYVTLRQSANGALADEDNWVRAAAHCSGGGKRESEGREQSGRRTD